MAGAAGHAAARTGGYRQVSAVAERRRVRLHVRGTVQGVGFRPFIYRIAHELGVTGWVANDSAGAVIDAEADDALLERFIERLHEALPPHASITSIAARWLDPDGRAGFEIRHSDDAGPPTALVLPDVATCDRCLIELRRPGDRRRDYAFTNCTHCGPRFSIIQGLPYDRARTTMAGFTLCPACDVEYRDPVDRRFHAQPNACPVCGPHLAVLDTLGTALLERGADREAVLAAGAAIAGGGIVAVKGIGGYLLLCDAGNSDVVERLRARKHRPTRPLALLVRGITGARAVAQVTDEAAALLLSPAAPIVLLPRRADAPVAEAVAPGHPYLGVMLPCAPLLHLLMDVLQRPLVATSGNLSEEPICITEAEALDRLGGIADLFLTHDRPITRHVDDSVAVILDGAPCLLRRARGYAPLPVPLPGPVPELLAVGAHMKNAVAVARGTDAFLSQHIGDLETHASQLAFTRVIDDLLAFYRITPVAIAHDLHPDYISTRYARELAGRIRPTPRLIAVQHHHAHLAACLAEHGRGRALGMIWDGTGYGPDGTVWGGEFLLGDAHGYERSAHLRPFLLPGGDAATHEGDRVALALLAQLPEASRRDVTLLRELPAARRRVLERMLQTGTNTPRTSSMGRLFDGVAALLGIARESTYEGEAAIRLEHAVDGTERGAYGLPLHAEGQLDWRVLLLELLDDRRRGTDVGKIAGRFHNALVAGAIAVAERVAEPRVALSGGCFQNRILVERV
ncbi:MAG TPA: carbamoyltransferase HypF, partial [Longimicrobiales bacterium]|nr:carbamoyltransferase HypF [Longimicrobiales bacterium]